MTTTRRRWVLATGLLTALLAGAWGGHALWYYMGPGRRNARMAAIQQFIEAQQLIRERRLEEAERKLRVCLRVIPEHHEAVSWLVDRILYPQGRTREAAELLADSYPHVPRQLRLTWLMLLWTMHFDERAPERLVANLQLMQEALRVEPVFENRLGLAFNLVTRGEPDDLRRAFPLLEQCLQERPDNIEARRLLFGCLMDLEQFDQAAQLLRNLPETARTDPDVLRMRARMALVRDDRDAAMAAFQQLLEQRPADVQAHYQLGRFYQQLGREKESAYHFERHAWATQLQREGETLLEELKDDGDTTNSADNCYRMGEITEAMGFRRQARGWYEVCLDRRPGDRQASAALARLGGAR